jgi:hypothetical protein
MRDIGPDQNKVLAIHRVDRVGHKARSSRTRHKGQFQFPVVMPTVTVPFPRNHGTAGLEEFDGTGTIFPAQEPEGLSG